MWSDNDTNRDFLNFRCVADTAAELIVQAGGTPLSMGVSGGWGVGKSSMLNLISDALEKREGSAEKYLFVRFNAWLYQGYDDTRAALMEEISTALVELASKKDDPSIRERASGLLKRVQWLRVLATSATSAVTMALGLPPVGVIGQAAAAVQALADGDATDSDVKAFDKAETQVKNTATTFLKPKKSDTPPAQIAALRKHLQETLSELDVTLVVLIDDLDRCLPSTAISTLEAVRLFLFLTGTAFIIAADDKMIRQAVRSHFKEVQLNDDLVTNYFDKLIQIPLRVPPLGTQEVRAYLMLLYVEKSDLDGIEVERVRSAVCGRLSETWKGKRVDRDFMQQLMPDCPADLRRNLQTADRLAPLLTRAKNVAGNPRLIKRFLNTLSIRIAVAKSQGVTVDEPTLAKVLLFERCASDAAYQRLVSAVNDAENGQPSFLREWEAQARAGRDIKIPDKDWDTPFVRDWLVIEPAFGELDLRAVIYVSRESLPIITAADQMSTDALGILEALVSLEAVSVDFREQIQALPGRDHGLMAERLMVRARQEQSWGTPSVLYAFIALIDSVPDVTQSFVDFLQELDHACLTAALVPLLNEYRWADQVLEDWGRSKEASGPVRKAIQTLSKRRG